MSKITQTNFRVGDYVMAISVMNYENKFRRIMQIDKKHAVLSDFWDDDVIGKAIDIVDLNRSYELANDFPNVKSVIEERRSARWAKEKELMELQQLRSVIRAVVSNA